MYKYIYIYIYVYIIQLLIKNTAAYKKYNPMGPHGPPGPPMGPPGPSMGPPWDPPEVYPIRGPWDLRLGYEDT